MKGISKNKIRIHRKEHFESNVKKLKEVFESAYLFLLIDQYEDGLWGKSITPELKKQYTGREEENKSITVTFYAVDAIYLFTQNREHPAIKSVFRILPTRRDVDGSYGSFISTLSKYPVLKYKISKNCRHTATALLTYLLLEEENENMIESIKFLIDHQKRDGGWGNDPDLKVKDQDPITTAHVTRLLILLKEKKMNEFLPRDYLLKLDEAINKGLEWLEQNNRENNGFWYFPSPEGQKEILFSAYILSIFPELKIYRKELYETTLERIVSAQDRKSGGWPPSLGEKPDVRTTVWVVNSLISEKDKYAERIEKGLDFIIKNISNPFYTENLIAADWAFLLKVAEYKNIRISQKLDNEIQALARNIKERFDRGSLEFLELISRRFSMLRAPLLRMFKNYLPYIFAQIPIPLLRESIIIIGSYDDQDIKELEEIKDYLNRKGYKAYLVKDLPDPFEGIFKYKTLLYVLLSKFCIWIYRRESWGISEYEKAVELHKPIAIIGPKRRELRMLSDQLKNIHNAKVFGFNESPFEVIDFAVEWVEEYIRRGKGENI